MLSHPGVPYLIKTLVGKTTFEYSFSSQNRKGKPFLLTIGDFEIFNYLKNISLMISSFNCHFPEGATKYYQVCITLKKASL